MAQHAVADSVHAGDIRLHLVVDDDPAAVVVDLAGFQIQGSGVGLTADGNQNLFGLETDGFTGLVLADYLGCLLYTSLVRLLHST